MLRLDPFSENVLFQCDRCRWVGELFTEVVESEGFFYCWNCLGEINRSDRREAQKRKEAYAAQ